MQPAHVSVWLRPDTIPKQGSNESRQASCRRSDYNTYPPLGLLIMEVVGRRLLLLEATSKTLRPSHPDLAVGLEALYHHIPLGLILPEVTEK